MKHMVILVGPPGSGKSTLAKQYEADGYVRVNQDSQGRMYTTLCIQAVERGDNIVVDRMNFSQSQREPFVILAHKNGYKTEIIVLHQPYDVCFQRIMARKDHETIKDETAARAALHTFFTKYERPQPYEAHEIKHVYPEGPKPSAVVCDLDGTLCNVEHRRHFVRREGKKDWKGFFEGIKDDSLNRWCAEILHTLSGSHSIVLCSGRGAEYRQPTVEWLGKHSIFHDALYMRHARDSRQDYIVKEIILDFEILTRYTPYFFIDDRKQVVDMWRSRGFTCLQCDEGDF